jgi:hypothetical protein
MYHRGLVITDREFRNEIQGETRGMTRKRFTEMCSECCGIGWCKRAWLWIRSVNIMIYFANDTYFWCAGDEHLHTSDAQTLHKANQTQHSAELDLSERR